MLLIIIFRICYLLDEMIKYHITPMAMTPSVVRKAILVEFVALVIVQLLLRYPLIYF